MRLVVVLRTLYDMSAVLIAYTDLRLSDAYVCIYIYVCSLAFAKVQESPQLAIYFGNPITSREASSSGSGRRLIAHSAYEDAAGRQHVQVHGRLEGPRCEGAMHADMVFAGSSGLAAAWGLGMGSAPTDAWEMDWMYVDVGPPYRKRVVLQHQQPQPAASPSAESQ